jgi:hypothetical protein
LRSPIKAFEKWAKRQWKGSHGTVSNVVALSNSLLDERAAPAHTNTVEGYFSILKRGVMGTYHHISQTRLKRYLGEFDFRDNERSALGIEDVERATKLLPFWPDPCE